MKNDDTKRENSDYNDEDGHNIISIDESNQENTEEDELMDYDFDYDPNEMYFALSNEN